jgi:ABC-type uncharacterized transport system substrate-binding protein
MGLLLLVSAHLSAAQGIEVVLSGSEDLYQRVADALQGGLSDGTASGPLPLTLVQADGYRTMNGSVITVAIGMKACEAAVAERSSLPLLCALVPRAELRRLANPVPSAGLAAVYLDQPVERQLALGRALLPRARRAGLLAGPQLRREAAEVRRSARAAGFRADLKSAEGPNDAALGIERLVAANDVVFAVYEPGVFTPAVGKWLLHLAYQQRIPVIGFSRAYVEAGAVAAVFSTPEQIGRQAAEVLRAWLDGGRRRLGGSAYPRYFKVAVNRPVAEALGIDHPGEEELASRVAAQSGGRP